MGIGGLLQAKLLGAGRVIVIGAPEGRLRMAARLGADETIDITQLTTADERVEAVMNLTNARGADLVVECSGAIGATQEGLRMVRFGGKYLLVGPWTDYGTQQINPNAHHQESAPRERGSRVGAAPHRSVDGGPPLNDRRARRGTHNTHRFPLGQVNEAFEVHESLEAMGRRHPPQRIDEQRGSEQHDRDRKTEEESMAGRVAGKVAVVVGGGQTPGETIGNGRATAIVLAREGARVVVADRDQASAQDTVDMIANDGGDAVAAYVDATDESSVAALISGVAASHGSLDVLHNNVGASLALGDAVAVDMTEDAFDRSFAVNLKSHWMACKHAIPIMRSQGGGSIVNISSLAVLEAYPYIGYKTMKTAVIALTQNLASAHADAGVRVNTILPGLMDTPMGHRGSRGAGNSARAGHRDAERQSPPRAAHGNGLGRRQRGAVPAFRRGAVHQRNLVARRWSRVGKPGQVLAHRLPQQRAGRNTGKRYAA